MEHPQRSYIKVKNWIKFTCIKCGQEFYIPPACAKRTPKYCGIKCMAVSNKNRWKFPKKHPEGYKQPNYKKIYIDGKVVSEHRYIMEQKLNRKLNYNEHVHHIDGNRLNNSIDNLVVIGASEHHRIEILEQIKNFR